MGIYGVYIVSKSGGLIFNYDFSVPKIETEQTFGYPLDLKLSYENNRVLVSFNQRDSIKGNVKCSTTNKCSSVFTNRIHSYLNMITSTFDWEWAFFSKCFVYYTLQ